jgi:hypothetical protein
MKVALGAQKATNASTVIERNGMKIYQKTKIDAMSAD